MTDPYSEKSHEQDVEDLRASLAVVERERDDLCRYLRALQAYCRAQVDESPGRIILVDAPTLAEAIDDVLEFRATPAAVRESGDRRRKAIIKMMETGTYSMALLGLGVTMSTPSADEEPT